MGQDRIISYADFKRRICRQVLNEALGEFPREEVLLYLQKEEPYIKDMYETSTNEERYRGIYGKRPDFEEMLKKFKNGDYLESDIAGTVVALRMMFE